MNAQLSIQAPELDRFADQLRGLGVKLADLEAPNAEAGRLILAAARPPRLSGTLDASLAADVTAQGVAFASTARYWTFVHYGAPRRNIRARMFLAEAVNASATEVAAVYAAHAETTIKTLD